MPRTKAPAGKQINYKQRALGKVHKSLGGKAKKILFVFRRLNEDSVKNISVEASKKMTGETSEVRSDKRKQREERGKREKR